MDLAAPTDDARPDGATAAVAVATAEQALAVALQHPPCQTPAVVCKLLASSRRLAALVAQASSASLTVSLRRAQVADGTGAAWLAKHGGLVSGVEARLDACGASADPRSAGAAAERLLAALPSGLTHLNAVIIERPADANAVLAAALAAALPRLTNLRSLEAPMHWTPRRTGAALLPAVAALSALTALRMPRPASTADAAAWAAALPTSLRRLDLSLSDQGTDDFATSEHSWLALTHLPGLSLLKLAGAVVDGGELPSTLQWLSCDNVVDAAPLTRMSNLLRLTLTAAAPPPEALAALSCMRQLRELHLHFNDGLAPLAFHAASSGLRHLPPQTDVHLQLWCQSLTAETAADLGAHPGIACLRLQHCGLSCGGALAALSSSLSRLARLQHAALHELRVPREAPPPPPAAWAALGQALGRLPALRSCELVGMPLLAGGVACVGEAARLTALQLGDIGLTDASLEALMVASHARLRELALREGESDALTDTALRLLAAWQPQLRLLWLGRVAPAGIRQLQAALPRCKVVVSS